MTRDGTAILFVLALSLLSAAVFISCGGDDDDVSSQGADDDASQDDDQDDDVSDDDAQDDDSAEADDDATGQLVIDEATLEDKILGAWVGQMAGVNWGAPTEFNYTGRIIPEDEIPDWYPGMINLGFIQDDLYVEIPFLDATSQNGPTVGWGVLGDMFKDTKFPLWHANHQARQNLRNGIPAPDSGHYSNNEHCDDIDWQIEVDYIGAMCPGLINQAIDMAWRGGHVINFGDGVLGGVFISAMHAAAFFADDVSEIIEAGRQALPVGSKYRAMVDDAIQWHDQGKDWEETWQLIQDKWGEDDRCPSYDNILMNSFNIDAKMNGTYVLMGLLYGEGDLENSMLIAMRCGQDSDCNPSSVGSILGNWMGLSKIPEKYKKDLNFDGKFIATQYTLQQSVDVNLELAKEVMTMSGAEAGQSDGQEIWSIPAQSQVQPPILEQWPESPNDAPTLTANVVSQEGMTVEFQASASDADGILDYEWYFGDLQRAKGANVVHEYAKPGVYQVISYVADEIGNTSWKALEVGVQ